MQLQSQEYAPTAIRYGDNLTMPKDIFFHSRLTPAEKLVFMCISHPPGQMSSQTNEEISRLCGVSHITASSALRKFEELGLVTVYYFTRDGEKVTLKDGKGWTRSRAIKVNYVSGDE